MSLHSYYVSKGLTAYDPPLQALVMAAMRKADTGNLAKLVAAFPEIWGELEARYDAPGGLIDEESSDPEFARACLAEVGWRG